MGFYLAKLGWESMAEVFTSGLDLHTETARSVLGKETVTDEERQVGKTLNFSMIYGGGSRTIREQLNVSSARALDLLDNFHRQWPGIGRKDWKHREPAAGTLIWYLDQKIQQRGYLKTLWGRHLRPDSDHKRLNALIQGCAADLMRSSLVAVHKSLKANDFKSHIVNVVHDELILDCDEEEIPVLVQLVPPLMDHKPISAVVPIEVDIEWSDKSWGDKESYGPKDL